mmetsp:Transcript_2217/g.1964  ORF Transcript_2217/g.1964 Transcript_2217/m.1964 type:complete len:107 (-) Transcript_2217:991-1311(-)
MWLYLFEYQDTMIYSGYIKNGTVDTQFKISLYQTDSGLVQTIKYEYNINYVISTIYRGWNRLRVKIYSTNQLYVFTQHQKGNIQEYSETYEAFSVSSTTKLGCFNN